MLVFSGENKAKNNFNKPIDQLKSIVSATRGTDKDWLEIASIKPPAIFGFGYLELKVNKPRSITLLSSGGSQISLKKVSGKMSLRSFCLTRKGIKSGPLITVPSIWMNEEKSFSGGRIIWMKSVLIEGKYVFA